MNCSDMGPKTSNSDKLARHHKMYRKSDKSHDLSTVLKLAIGLRLTLTPWRNVQIACRAVDP